MKNGDIIRCPDCQGRGKVRDRFMDVVTLGFTYLIADGDECGRCRGSGFLIIENGRLLPVEEE